jgi:hypothetical protein
MYRCYYCGAELTWDDTKRSAGGKKIPLEADGTPHRCSLQPARDMGGNQCNIPIPLSVIVERVAKNQDELKVSLLELTEIVQTLQTKLEMMDGGRKDESIKVEQS